MGSERCKPPQPSLQFNARRSAPTLIRRPEPLTHSFRVPAGTGGGWVISLSFASLPNSHSRTYTVVMKNITLSVDENVLAIVRRHAAERNSTVNALVREYLGVLAAHEDRAKRARVRLRQLSAQSQGRLGKKTWTRADLHDR